MAFEDVQSLSPLTSRSRILMGGVEKRRARIGLHSVRGQGGPLMKLEGGEFSTGTMGNFQPELTREREPANFLAVRATPHLKPTPLSADPSP